MELSEEIIYLLTFSSPFSKIIFVCRQHLCQVPRRAHRQDEGLEARRGPPTGQGAGERREGRPAREAGGEHWRGEGKEAD